MGSNKPVDFTTAMLLKEKGFDQKCLTHYSKFINGKEELRVGDTTWLQFVNWNNIKNQLTNYTYYSAPTIAEVVMWLYEKHGIWIWVERYSALFRPYAEEIGNERFGKWEGHKYNSPTEAYKDAIEYCLTHKK